MHQVIRSDCFSPHRSVDVDRASDRQQAWFRAHVAPDGLPPFSSKHANALSPLPVGSFRARVLIGRGPVEHELTPEVLFWFEHGEQEYPTFQCPSIGPSGAGLKVSSRPRTILATEQDVLCLIEISVVQPVGPEFHRQFEESTAENLDNTSAEAVKKWRDEALAWLERAIGLYALYQYPIVWEPLAVTDSITLFDVITRVILPIGTFFAGALLASWIKKRDLRRETLRQHAKLVADLTAVWYRQLDAIRLQVLRGAPDDEIRRLDQQYVYNREVLPYLLLSRNVLVGYVEAAEVTQAVNDFLALVTTPRDDGDRLTCQPLVRFAHFTCRSSFRLNDRSRAVDSTRLQELMNRLDEHQQRVATSASRLFHETDDGKRGLRGRHSRRTPLHGLSVKIADQIRRSQHVFRRPGFMRRRFPRE